MARPGVELNIPTMDIVPPAHVRQIRRATLDVLWTTGIAVEDPEVLTLFEKAGCKVDRAANRVRMPERLVNECLDLCPSSYYLKARERENDLHIKSGGNTYFDASNGMKYLDLDTWTNREPTRKEFHDTMIVHDCLEHLDMQSCFPYWGFAKVPDCMRMVESAAAKIRASGKIQQEGSVGDEYRWIEALGRAADTDIVMVANSTAPLTFFKSFTDRVRFGAEKGQALHFTPGPTKGFTAPVTIAGSMVSNNAEIVAAMALAQLVRPGTRCWAVSMILTPNMANGLTAFGDIGQSLSEALFTQVWRSYNIPCVTCSSSWSSAMTLDYQAGYELSMPALLATLSNASVVVFFGSMNSQLSAHPAKSIIDNDVVGMIKRFARGVDVTPDSLAVDLINETGPLPANFLDTDHTFEWWRNECHIPEVANRTSGQKWFDEGRKGTLELAREKMEDILANHRFPALTAAQDREIEAILDDARQHYRKQGRISDADWALYQEDLHSPNYPFA